MNSTKRVLVSARLRLFYGCRASRPVLGGMPSCCPHRTCEYNMTVDVCVCVYTLLRCGHMASVGGSFSLRHRQLSPCTHGQAEARTVQLKSAGRAAFAAGGRARSLEGAPPCRCELRLDLPEFRGTSQQKPSFGGVTGALSKL